MVSCPSRQGNEAWREYRAFNFHPVPPGDDFMIIKKSSTAIVTLLIGISISAIGITRLDAQASTASIQGTVTDASGAAIPDSTVQMRNVNTGAIEVVTSDAQ